MGIQFLGPSTPPGFVSQSHLNVINGSKAIAPKQIFDNQAWLATQDIGAGTLYTSPTGVLAHLDEAGSWAVGDPTGTLHTTGPIEQRIKVSPYAAYVDIWVWCVRDYAIGAVANPTIYARCVETGDVRSSTLISGGTDSTGKTASYPACDEAQWVRLEGVPVGGVEASDAAVQVRRDQSSDHKPVTLQVWASDDSVRIYTVCYRVLPFKGSMSSWDGEEATAFYSLYGGEQLTVPAFTPTAGDEWTISFWFRFRSLPPEGVYAKILITDDGAEITDANYLRVKSSCELSLSDSLEDVVHRPPARWHHFAATVQPEGNVWVDGVSYGGDSWGTVTSGDFTFRFGDSNWSNAVLLDVANICIFDGVYTSPGDLYGDGKQMKFDPRNSIGSWSGTVPALQYIKGRNLSGEVVNSGDAGTANLISSADVVTSIAF